MCRSGPVDWRPRPLPMDQARPPPWLLRRLGLPQVHGLGQPGDMGKLPDGHWSRGPFDLFGHQHYPGDGYSSRAGWGGHPMPHHPAYAGEYRADPGWGGQWGGVTPLPGPPAGLHAASFYPPDDPTLCGEPGGLAFYPHESGRISTSTDRWTEPAPPLDGGEDGFDLAEGEDGEYEPAA